MRTLFLALLFANLLYFGWAQWIAPPPSPQVNDTLAHLPRLKLAAEVPAQPAPRPTPTVAQEPGCFSVGPFGDVDNGAKAAALLRNRGFAPRQRAQAGETAAGWGVFVTGFASQAESDRALATLERNGISDVLVMPPTAEMGRRLSLGLFSERSRAEKRAAAVRTLGLKTEVIERRIPGTLYWIDLAPLPGMNGIPLQDLFAEGVSSKIAVQPCSPQVTAQAAKNAGSPPQPAGVPRL